MAASMKKRKARPKAFRPLFSSPAWVTDIGIITMINKNDNSALEKANKFNSELEKNNIDAIIDDTDENFSSKIKKMNLIGAPYQIIIGKQTEGDLIEFKEVGKETKKLKIAEIIEIIKKQKEKN